ncbi:hypothetical protein GCM10027612_44650 [Microbispora bryophytorum subsp. camponoti]
MTAPDRHGMPDEPVVSQPDVAPETVVPEMPLPEMSLAPETPVMAKMPEMNGHWVPTWTAMPQLTEPDNMPPSPFTRDGIVLADATLRQTVRVSVGGRRMRVRVSNAFGGAALPVTKVTVAAPAGGGRG